MIGFIVSTIILLVQLEPFVQMLMALFVCSLVVLVVYIITFRI